jgi:hypothetical protein
MLGERRRRLCTETRREGGGGGFAFESDVDNGMKIWRDGMEGVFLRCMRMTCGVFAGAVVGFPSRDCRGKW